MNPPDPNSWVLQFVGGSGPRLPKYLNSYSPGGRGAAADDVILYSPLIATSPGKHDTVELAVKVGVEIGDRFPITE
jgi:hypothetical protein